MSKTFIIGDVHGCNDKLVELLNKIQLNREEDTVIFVGDYFDRGPKSYEVWCTLKELKKDMGERCVLVRGNHEVMLCDYVLGLDNNWMNNGYETTIRSFVNQNGVSLGEIRKWIEETTVRYYEGPFFDVVHAGREEEDLSKEDPDFLIWDRSLYRGRSYDGKLTFTGHSPYGSPLFSLAGRIGILDHEHAYDLPEYGAINLDTACVYGGKLTAAEISEDKKIRLHSVESGREER